MLADAAKLPLDERVAHSNWKARSAAYEAVKAGCSSVFDSEDPVLLEYGERNLLGVAQSWGLLCNYCCTTAVVVHPLWHHSTMPSRLWPQGTVVMLYWFLSVPCSWALSKGNNRWQRSSAGQGLGSFAGLFGEGA